MRPFLYLLYLLLCLSLAPAAPGATAPAQAQEDPYASGEEMAADEDDEDESAEAEPSNEEASPGAAEPGRRNAYGVVLRPDTYALDDRPGRSHKAPHPLQLANPEHDVIVCEAGCGDSRGAIVYMQRKPLPKAR